MIERQLDYGLDAYWDAGASLRHSELRGIVTCARGTSDHAAMFFKYLVETRIGLPVASIGPSVASIYGARLKLDGFASFAFSQSGASPDLSALQDTARQGGARTIAVCNVTDSALADGADTILPVHAGPEMAVAATKSFIGMLFATLGTLAGMMQDRELKSELETLPDLARRTLGCSWASALEPISRSGSMFCLGRGPGLAIAGEAALKFKETCRLHAEAYSAAEVFHGPVAIADERFAALVFDARGLAASSIEAACRKMQRRNVVLFIVTPRGVPHALPVPGDGHELFDPLLQAIAFYNFVKDLSWKLGENPDTPTGLNKITETI